jgi:hypothetical protein
MKRLIVIAAMIAAFGLGGAAAFAATTDKPPSPPGQGECEHGNSQKPCKDDPQPNHGQDCDEHGNQGGVNEDHCTSESTPTETTPTDTTPTETTPAESTPTQTSSTETTPTETTTPSSGEEEPPAQEPGVFLPPAQESTKSASKTELVAAGASQAAAKPSTAAQPAPFTP